MNKKSFVFGLVFLIIAIATHAQELQTSNEIFGKSISEKGAVSVKKLPKRIHENESLPIKVKGTITEVCQSKGCWMTIDLGNNETMRVKFKDYGFFVPKDAAGKTAIMEGIAQNETVSVEELKHLAKDAGKSEEEIAKIDQSSEELTFVAEGVIIK